MADRDVTIRVNVQGAEQAARSMENLAQKTQQAANAAESLEGGVGGRRGLFAQNPGGISDAEMRARQERFLGRFSTGGTGNDIADEAQRRLDRQERNRKINRQMKVLQGLDPDAPEDDDGLVNGMRGRAGIGLGRRWQSQALTVVGLSAGGAFARGVGQGVSEIGDDVRPLADSIGLLARRGAEALPVIGGIVKGVGDLIETARGVAQAREFGRQGVATAERAARLESGIQGIELSGLSRQAQLDRLVSGASADSAAAGAFASGLTPERLASFNPRVGTFANEQTGHLRMAAFEAETGAAAAARVAEEERARFGRTLGSTNLDRLNRNIGAAQSAADRAQIRAQNSAEVARTTPWYVGSGEVGVQAEKDRAEAIQRQVTLKGLLEQKEKALQTIAEQRNALMQAEQKSAESQARLAESRLNLEKNRLELVHSQVARAESGALAAGLDPMQAQRDLEVARLAEMDPRSIPAEEAARLAARSPYFRRKFTDIGAADPSFQRFQERYGAEELGTGGNLGDLRAQEREIADAVARAYAEARQAFTRAFETATKEGAEDLGKANVELVKTMVAKAKNEILIEIGKEQQQRPR